MLFWTWDTTAPKTRCCPCAHLLRGTDCRATHLVASRLCAPWLLRESSRYTASWFQIPSSAASAQIQNKSLNVSNHCLHRQTITFNAFLTSAFTITARNLISEGCRRTPRKLAAVTSAVGWEAAEAAGEGDGPRAPRAGSGCCGPAGGASRPGGLPGPLVCKSEGFLNLTSSFASLPLSLNVLFDEREGAEGI